MGVLRQKLRSVRTRPFNYERSRFTVFLLQFTLFAVLIGALLFAADARLRPAVREYALTRASYLATKAINDAVNEELETDEIDYLDLVTLEKDDSGRVTALHTNIIKVNNLKSKMSNIIIEELSRLDTSQIAVPLGNATGIDFFSGMGPNIDIEIIPLGSASTDFKSAFSSAGINQTRHRITMEISADVTILLPRDAVTQTVTTQVNVAETVIVGIVPDSYTNIEDSRSAEEKVIDFTLE